VVNKRIYTAGAGHNPARHAFIIDPGSIADVAKIKRTSAIVTHQVEGAQRSTGYTRTAFGNDFCDSSHGKTEGILRRSSGRKSVQKYRS